MHKRIFIAAVVTCCYPLLIGSIVSTSLHAQERTLSAYPAVNDACLKRSGLQANGEMMECVITQFDQAKQKKELNTIEIEMQSDGSFHSLNPITLSGSNTAGYFMVAAARIPQPVIAITLPKDEYSAAVQDSLRRIITQASDSDITNVVLTPADKRNPAIELQITWSAPGTPVKLSRVGDRPVGFRQQAPLHYPISEQVARHSGTTLVQAEIDDTGHVRSAGVIQSSGYDNLDSSCISMVERSLFWPLLSNGVPEKSAVKVPCHF